MQRDVEGISHFLLNPEAQGCWKQMAWLAVGEGKIDAHVCLWSLWGQMGKKLSTPKTLNDGKFTFVLVCCL